MRAKSAIVALLFSIGFISMGTQIYLIREFLKVFGGNELVAGLVFSLWVLITGAGAWIGKSFSRIGGKLQFVFFLLYLLALLPCLMPMILALLRALIVPYGSAVSIVEMLYICFLVQLPFCLFSGFLFTALGYLLFNQSVVSPVASPYTAESVGSMVSGGLVNFIFLMLFDAHDSLILLTLVYLSLTGFSAFILLCRPAFGFLVLISVVFLFFMAWFDFTAMKLRLLYPDQRILMNHETPYGEVVITGTDKQLNYYENGMLLFSSGNMISNEEHVHFAMCQNPFVREILLISGGFSGTIGEILKYNPRRIDYIELNPALIEIGERYASRQDQSRIIVHNTDARRFVNGSTRKYDVVLVNLPEPSTLQVNRLYTIEFLHTLKRSLAPGAVVAYSLPTGSNYVSEKAGRLNAAVFRTLEAVFRNVIIVPAGRNYFLASDSSLTHEIPARIALQGIPTGYVNGYYLDALQLKERSDYIIRSMPADIQLNRDYHPVAFFYQVEYLLSFFSQRMWVVAIVAAVLFFLALFTLNPVSSGIFSGGFTAAATQVMLIVALQVNLGYMFQATGGLILAFMCGLGLGSFLSGRLSFRSPFRSYLAIQIILSLFAILLPGMLLVLPLSTSPGWIVFSGISVLSFTVALIVGLEFGLAGMLYPGDRALANAGNYRADLFGSAFGAFLFTFMMFPLLGMIYSGLLLAILNLCSAGWLFFRRRFFIPL